MMGVKMKNGREIIFALTMILALSVLTGCNNNVSSNTENSAGIEEKKVSYDTTGDLTNNSLIMTIGDVKVGYAETSVYMRELKDQYQTTFGNTIWSYDLGNGKTFADMAKEEVINQISQLKIIGLMAPELGIEITEEEKVKISANVKKYLSSVSDERKNQYGITEEVMMKSYSDNFLASKVFDVTTSDVNTEISEDESKQITIQQILIKTGGEDEEGNKIELTDKEKKQALLKARTLLTQAKKEEDFYTFAEKNTQDVDVEYTFGKGEMPKAVEEAAFALKTGELSKIVVSEDGYYILYCVSDYDETATDEVKEKIIDDRKNTAFEEAYAKWSKNYNVEINNTMWDQVSFLTEEEKTSINQKETDKEETNKEETNKKVTDVNGNDTTANKTDETNKN